MSMTFISSFQYELVASISIHFTITANFRTVSGQNLTSGAQTKKSIADIGISALSAKLI